VHILHNAAYVSLKAGPVLPNDLFLSFSGLWSRNKVSKISYIILTARAPLPTSHSTVLVEMGSFSETSDEKRSHVSVDSQQVDTGAQLDANLRTQLDPSESLRIR
jgi:hypothetical protein